MDSEKCWRRRLRSLISFALLVTIATTEHVAAQPSEPSNAERGLATLEAFLDGVRSLTANFKQELWTADQRLLQTETGTLSLKRPNRFRWTYAEPMELVVAADGEQLWIYDVDLAQVTIAKFDDTVGSSPAMLLSGDRNVREEFEVVESYPADGLDWIKLAPRASGSDFASVLIGFDGTAPRRLELVDGLGQVTRIELDDLSLNPELTDDLFELDVPEDVDIIGGEG